MMMQAQNVDKIDCTPLQEFVDLYFAQVKKVEANYTVLLAALNQQFAKLSG